METLNNMDTLDTLDTLDILDTLDNLDTFDPFDPFKHFDHYKQWSLWSRLICFITLKKKWKYEKKWKIESYAPMHKFCACFITEEFVFYPISSILHFGKAWRPQFSIKWQKNIIALL